MVNKVKKNYNYLRDLSSNQNISLLEYFIFFLIIFIMFYYGFHYYALENMNEGLYAEIPREMIMTGNYIVPHLNFVPYLEKPPLLYWLIAASYHLFGISGFSARFIPVTAGALTCFITFLFAKKVCQPKAGWIAGIILATSAGFILISRVIIFDMVLTLFFSASLFCFYLWYAYEKKTYLWLCYFLIGLSFMTKGMLAVVLIPGIAFIFMLWDRTPWQKILKAIDLVGICIFLLTTLPWIVAASIKQSGFAWDFFINEQVYRFLNKRIPHDYHHGPIYYYVLPLIIILLPWTVFLPSLFKPKNFISGHKKSFKKFLWIWFFLPFIFFSLSQAKAQYYIIISIPALALLLALKISEYFQENDNKTLKKSLVILLLLIVIFLGITCLAAYSPYLQNRLPDNWLMPPELNFPLLMMLITMVLYAVFAFTISYFFNTPIISFLLIAGLMVPWICFLISDKQRLQPERSAISIGNYIITQDNKRSVYLYRDYENISSILFYTKKRIPIIDSVSKDLYYGSTTPDAKGWFITAAQFTEQASKRPVYVVLLNNNLQQFQQTVPLTFCKIMQSGDTLLLSNKLQDCKK